MPQEQNDHMVIFPQRQSTKTFTSLSPQKQWKQIFTYLVQHYGLQAAQQAVFLSEQEPSDQEVLLVQALHAHGISVESLPDQSEALTTMEETTSFLQDRTRQHFKKSSMNGTFFYTLKETDFQEVEAEQLQEGDVLALSSPEYSISSQRYGAIQIGQPMHIGPDVVISYRLPPGAHLHSSSQVHIDVDWEDDHTPLITIFQHIEKKQKVLRKR